MSSAWRPASRSWVVDRGFSPADRRAVVMAGVAEYRDRMRQAAGMGALDAWYDHLEAGMLLKLVREEVRVKRVTKAEAQAFERDVNKAYTRDNTRVFTKRAAEVDGELRIVADPPLIIPIEDLVTPGSEWEDPAAADQEAAQRLPAHPRATSATRWRSTATSTRPTRWSAWAASGPAATSC